MSTQPRPLPRGERQLRQVKCYGCNDLTGIPGAGYCDACRPGGNRRLFTDVDDARAMGPHIARCPECGGEAIATPGIPAPALTHRERCSEWSDAWAGRPIDG